ncbi:MAG: hypothetical protein H7318_08290 [Oligoflexus sp.]|nr:hypothetical protein [Oligoflexus sp.]
MGTATDDRVGTKAERIYQISLQVTDYKKNIEELTKQMNDISLEEVLKVMEASLAETKANLSSLEK